MPAKLKSELDLHSEWFFQQLAYHLPGRDETRTKAKIEKTPSKRELCDLGRDPRPDLLNARLWRRNTLSSFSRW